MARDPRVVSTFERARGLYRNFRDREPTKIGRVRIPKNPRAVMVLGYLREVKYDSTGDVGPRVHTFAAGSRPLLCSDGKRLYIVKGRFRVTSRGIVDLDSRGIEES